MAQRKQEKQTYIVYNGFSDERSFGPEDWDRLGIEGQEEEVLFNPGNNKRMLKKDLEPEVVEHLLTRERYFAEEEH